MVNTAVHYESFSTPCHYQWNGESRQLSFQWVKYAFSFDRDPESFHCAMNLVSESVTVCTMTSEEYMNYATWWIGEKLNHDGQSVFNLRMSKAPTNINEQFMVLKKNQFWTEKFIVKVQQLSVRKAQYYNSLTYV